MNGIGSLLDTIGPTGGYKITDIHLTTDNVLAEGKSSAGAYILYPKTGMFDFASIKSFINGNINQ